MKALKQIFSYSGRTSLYLSLLKRKKLVNLACSKLKKRGVFICNRENIGTNFTIVHPLSIIIGSGTKIGNNVKIYHCVTIGQKKGQYPEIGDNVTIYPNSVIIGKIKIGDNSIIGAGSVVISDVPANSVVGGNPAKILKNI